MDISPKGGGMCSWYFREDLVLKKQSFHPGAELTIDGIELVRQTDRSKLMSWLNQLLDLGVADNP